MAIELFDVQCGFGGMTPGDPVVVSVDDLLAAMARLQITAALVRTTPEDRDQDIPASTDALYAAHAKHASLVPCPAVVPNRGGGLPSEDAQVAQHLANGCGAVCIRPSVDYWSLAPWMCDRLFSLLQARRLPVFCLERLVGIEEVGQLAGRFPSLPIIVAGVTYRQQRTLLSLLESFPNVHLSLGSNYTVHRGIEELVPAVGPERLLFGTGFPQAEPMAAITQLMYAEISDDSKQLIGAGNLRRLIAEIAR